MPSDDWNDSVDSDWAYDGESVTRDAIENGGGGGVNKEGKYHFVVADVTPELSTTNDRGEERSPSILFRCIVMHDVDGQSPVGSALFHRIYLAGKGGTPAAEGTIKSAMRFGLGLGLLKYAVKDDREIVVDAATGSPKISSRIWQAAKDRHFIAEVKLEKGTGTYKDKYVIPFGEIHRPDDPEVADVPKNVELLAAVGIKASPGLATAAPVGATTDEFAGL